MKGTTTVAAQDAEDLQIISAQLQDAVARIKDLVYLPRKRRFAALFNRFKWEESGKRSDLRVRAGLHIDNVLRVQSHDLRQDKPDAVVSLLAIRFTPKAPEDCAGVIEFIFAGGGTLRLEVEAIDAALADLGGPWAARGRPVHDADTM